MIEQDIAVFYNGHLGTDLDFMNAAKTSLYTSSDEINLNLMERLGWSEPPHTSPFEHCYFRTIIECPLYIAMEVLRHRTFSYNMVSRRYTSQNITWFMYDQLKFQNKKNKQGAVGDLPKKLNDDLIKRMRLHTSNSEEFYNELIDLGVAREQARVVLPQNLMTRFWMSGNFKNWVGFLKLRDHPAAQAEIQLVARKIGEMMRPYFPEGMRILFDGNTKTKLNNDDLDWLLESLDPNIDDGYCQTIIDKLEKLRK